MNRLLFLTLALLLCSSSPLAQEKPVGSDEIQIRQLERAWNQAEANQQVNEVSNRGGNAIPTTAAAVVPGAIYLQSGWQGDLLAHCATDYPCTPLNVPFTGTQQVIQVPVAKNLDGSTITGPVYGHIANATGNTAQMVIFTTPVPYQPLSMDTTKTEFWSLASQTITGVDGPKTLIPSADWAWADCSTVPFPGTPDPTRICLRNGFNSDLLYEMVFTAKNPLVLGVGYAATRDIISFFHHASADGNGTPNPIAISTYPPPKVSMKASTRPSLAARMRSARVPCGLNSSSSLPDR